MRLFTMVQQIVNRAVQVMAVAILLLCLYLLTLTKYKMNTTYLFDTFRPRKFVKNKINSITAGESYCQVRSPWADNIFKHKITSDMVDWTFTKQRECPEFRISQIPEQRKQVILHCEASTPYMTTVTRESNDKIEEVQFGEACLIGVIDRCCYDENNVPNVAHFVWYEPKELGYYHYLALMSLLRFMKPCLILIHGPTAPYGKYWDSFIGQTPNIIHVQRKRPRKVFGRVLGYKQHSSDVMRIQALQAFGGLYIDFDEVLLRPIDSLRKYEYTQGHEYKKTLGSQFILAKKNATFLRKWLESYRLNYKRTWGFNALQVPWSIAVHHPDLIHVDGFNFTRPDWSHRDLILEKNYDWSINYAMHLFIRKFLQPIDTSIMRTLNTTIGSVSRHILLGNKELCIK